MKKAVFFDIDGTIVDTFNGINDISPAVRKALKDLQHAGHYIFIATGRPYAFISDMIWDFGFDGFVLSNGAQVILNGETVYEAPMDEHFKREIATLLKEAHIPYILEGGKYSYLVEEESMFYDFSKTINVSEAYIKKVTEIAEIDQAIYKAEIYCKDEETERKCKQIVDGYEEYDYYHSISGVLLEIFAKCNHKVRGIEKILEKVGIPLENSYAFGDGANDIKMLETVGCGFAMGNASDEVKAQAKIVADTVSNDGVAKAIYSYILKDSKAESKEVI